MKRYQEVLAGRALPNFFACKSVETEVSLNESDDTLWEEHRLLVDMLKSVELKPEEKQTYEQGNTLLDLKIELARRVYTECVFCERRCRVNREEKAGHCKVKESRVSSMFLHYGEEPELVPSCTVFFSGCNLNCVFCQNFDISQRITGLEVSPEDLAKKLEAVHGMNINWVGGSPTPNLLYILRTLNHYSGTMPSVWNSNMFMSDESMHLLEGTQDVFLTDLKYGNDKCAERFSKVKSYTGIVKRNHIMASEQGELLIRHLVLPGHIECCTKEVVRFVAEELGRDTRFNLMFQYRPMYKAHLYPDINRRLRGHEISAANRIAQRYGLTNRV